ncbi:MAG TPA: cysteine desulfurase family protein [Candidatus Paceibacterota bacterium]
MSRIYLDYASLTPIDARVVREMKYYSTVEFANPSSLYREGVAAKRVLADGRTRIAAAIHAHADEIVFTSGGTEANGLALEGAGRAAYRVLAQPLGPQAKVHLVTTNIEHSSVRETVDMLGTHGVEITRIPVGSNGIINLDDLKKAIKPNTYMVSIMTVNNEIGTVQPIRDIAKVIRHAREHIMPKQADGARSRYPLLHADAAQAAAYFNLNVEQLGVDLMTLDAGKVYGPRGMGALYIKRGTSIEPIVYGGGQERGLRSGTENIPAIMGFAKALELAAEERVEEVARVQALKEQFYAGLKEIAPQAVLNPAALEFASPDLAPNILNISIPGIDNEFFVLRLDAQGIAISTKSSCLRDEDESYVLRAIGADSKTSVRISFGRWTEKRHVRKVLKVIKKIMSR